MIYESTTKLIRELNLNKSVVVLAKSQKNVSAVFAKYKDKKFSQETVFLGSINHNTLERYYLVTRII